MKKIIFILLIVISACNNNTEQEKGVKIITACEDSNDKLLSIDYDISFVQLETSDECLLGYIRNFEFTKEYIYVLDRNTFYIFSCKGKFIKKVKRGKGPGELTRALNFSVDEKFKEIYIIEMGNIMHIYDLNANYKRTIKFNGSYTDVIRPDNDNFILYTSLFARFGVKYLISVYNIKKERIVKKFITNEKLPMKNLTILDYNNFYINSTDEIYFTACNSRTIYKYENDSMKPAYSIDFNKFEPPVSFIESFNKVRDFRKAAFKENYVGFLFNGYIFDDFLLVGFKTKNYNCGICFNDDNKLHLTTLSSLFDLPATTSFDIIGNAKRNTLYFMYNNDILLNSDITESEKNLTIKGKSIKIHDNNNPVIIELTLK